MMQMTEVKYYPADGGVFEVELPQGMSLTTYEMAMRNIADIPSATHLKVTLDERASMGTGKEVIFHHSRVAITHIE